MSENNKTYRLRTKIGTTSDSPIEDKYLTLNLNDSYDTIEVMSVKINQENAYRFHSSDYGVVVGRAIANGGFGVPNVKVSIFVQADQETLNDPVKSAIYPYTDVTSKNSDKVRYNLLPTELDEDCYNPVGTFPDKRLVLDDNNYLEIYDKYYKFTTRTNESGDYMIFGVPVGSHSLHIDMDLSDVGVLSQKPRDMIYKGYDKGQFNNPNQFKASTNLDSLPQIISQDTAVYVYPFWGDTSYTTIGITRFDIDIDYKFEPTCVFMGSIVSDSSSNRISKKCIPSENMGVMEELVTGTGTIEMIRKTITGGVEEFPIQGNQLIDSDGVWCYQIPMNLDYMKTDEFGNLVPSDNPEVGIPTRTRVRFRVSMDDLADDSVNTFRGKVLIPNNPAASEDDKEQSAIPDYVFGTLTDEDSYRDLLWNNIYTIKSFIPRFQKGNSNLNRRFSGIKMTNYFASNNPIPYNNMRVRLSFQFRIACLIVKLLIAIVSLYNRIVSRLAPILIAIGTSKFADFIRGISDLYNNKMSSLGRVLIWLVPLFGVIFTALAGIGSLLDALVEFAKSISCLYIDGALCDTLNGDWYFSPGCTNGSGDRNKYLWLNMMAKVEGRRITTADFSSEKRGDGSSDTNSIDYKNADKLGDQTMFTTSDGDKSYALSRSVDYFLQCVEISLAEEYKVIQFDFYNDWINGMLYIPRWERHIRRRRKFLGLFGKKVTLIKACNETFSSKRIMLTDQCSVDVNLRDNSIKSYVGCKSNTKYKCHKKPGRHQVRVLKNGVVHSELTNNSLYAYYFKPCEVVEIDGMKKKVNLFATDIVLLGSFNPWNISETPLFIDALQPTTYQMPSPLVLTDAEDEGNAYELREGVDEYYTDSDFKLNGVYFYGKDVLSAGLDGGSFTEQSGVDWGVTGPGQGSDNISKNYTPGGHFLGISCMNSQVTTKSCVNVKRICEIGVWPSSSYNIDNSDDTYFEVIPNGLISKDEISEGDFRKLFATLNHNRLSTKVDDDNFIKYNFIYLSPNNFGGEMLPYYKTLYNELVVRGGVNPTVVDPNDEGMQRYIDYQNDGEYEYGGDANLGIVRRTLEERDSDYMRFRLGLKEDSTNKIGRKYLYTSTRGYSMPVYENSYYFYFGLHNGSTALDKFRDDFYAECQKATKSAGKLKFELYYGRDGSPTADLTDDDSSVNTVDIFKTGLEISPSSGDSNYAYFNIHSEKYPITIVHVFNGESTQETINQDPDETNNLTKVAYNNSGDIFGDIIAVGTHTFRVTDADGASSTKIVRIKRIPLTVCGGEMIGHDFIRDDYIMESKCSLITGNSARNIYGGYISPSGGNCGRLYEYNGTPVSISNANIIIVCNRVFYTTSGVSASDIEYFENLGYTNGTPEGCNLLPDASENTIPVPNAGVYDVYVVHVSGSNRSTPILIGENVSIMEPETLDFSIFRSAVGFPESAFNSWRLSYINFGSGWYNNIDSLNITEEQKWYLKKDVYYVRDIARGETGESSERDLIVSKFYPSSVRITQDYTGPINTTTALTVPQQISFKYVIEGSDGVKSLPVSGTFTFKTIERPFYTKCVLFEGFKDDALEVDGRLTGTISGGTLYNGYYNVVRLNDTYDISGGNPTPNISQVFPISDNSLYDNPFTSLYIEEGYPDDFDSNYGIEVIQIETPTIGSPSNWAVYLDYAFDRDRTSKRYVVLNHIENFENGINTIYDENSGLGFRFDRTIKSCDSGCDFYSDVRFDKNLVWNSILPVDGQMPKSWSTVMTGYRKEVSLNDVSGNGFYVLGETKKEIVDGCSWSPVTNELCSRNIIRNIPDCSPYITELPNRKGCVIGLDPISKRIRLRLYLTEYALTEIAGSVNELNILYQTNTTHTWKTCELVGSGVNISAAAAWGIFCIQCYFNGSDEYPDFAGGNSIENAKVVAQDELFGDFTGWRLSDNKAFIMISCRPTISNSPDSYGLDGLRFYGWANVTDANVIN